MSPQELSSLLRSMAAYLEETPNPSQRAVIAGLNRAIGGLQVAGKVTKFVDRDYADAMHGLDRLIEKLTKASKTLNPQHEAKSELEHRVSELQALKAGLSEQFKEMALIDI